MHPMHKVHKVNKGTKESNGTRIQNTPVTSRHCPRDFFLTFFWCADSNLKQNRGKVPIRSSVYSATCSQVLSPCPWVVKLWRTLLPTSWSNFVANLQNTKHLRPKSSMQSTLASWIKQNLNQGQRRVDLLPDSGLESWSTREQSVSEMCL